MMNDSLPLLPFVVTALIAGLAGGIAMNTLMRILSQKHATPVDMTKVIGSLLTRGGGAAAGTAVHLGCGGVFGLLYLWGLHAINEVSMPSAMPIGLGFGIAHGIFVSILLMYLVRDVHPREEHRRDSVTFALGLVYVGGHAAYGFTVGLVGGLLAMAFGG